MNSPRDAGFGPVLAVRSLLSALTVPYWIAGGWAIDLAVGRVTRDHADVDIMLLERDEHALRTDLTEVDVQLIGRDGQRGPWPAGRRLLAGPGPGRPRPPIGADRLVLRGKNLPLPAEVLLASAVGASWVYYRGARCISRPLAGITRNRHGIPFLAPEVVLLFKSRSESDKDQRDVEAALPVLGAAQRSWLRTPWSTCHAGRPRLCPAGEMTRRHAARRRPAPLGICARRVPRRPASAPVRS